ncbi:MAG: hypothetical protein JRM97_09005 [Nitrososphaerota archaeon]|nr:hypothetical protein [Nitrososphaerota archaeon]
MSVVLRKDIFTTTSRDIDGIKQIEFQAKDALQKAATTGPNAIASPAIRPLLASDLNTSLAAGTAAFSVTASAAGNQSIISNFSIPSGQMYVFYGVLDLTAGTKYVDSIQFTINGNVIPLEPLPIVDVQQGPEPAVYFSPIKAVVPRSQLSITAHFTAAGTETLVIKGYIAQSGSAS